MTLELTTRTLSIAAAVGYGVSWILSLRGRRGWTYVMGLAWVLNLMLFAANWVAAGAPPFGNMYHVHVVLALCVPLLYAIPVRREGMDWAGGYFAFFAALVMVGACFMDHHVHWRRMPALQSPWFVPHVFTYMISYGLMAVAFVMTVVKWCRRKDSTMHLRYEQAASQIIRIGFPFMTFGLFSGALWAEEAWGVYWSWDPKETWSLITWCGYLAFLHCRCDKRLRPWADAAQLVGFLALLWTFFLVNLMPRLSSVLHSYAT